MYIRTDPLARVPQILDVVSREVPYSFALLHTSSLQRLEAPAGKSMVYRREHSHDIYHIVLYTHGRNRFLLNGEPRTVRPGTLAFTGPGESHSFGPHDAGQVSYMEVSFALQSEQGDLAVAPHELLGLYAGFDLPKLSMPVRLKSVIMRAISGRIALLINQVTRPRQTAWFAAYRTILELLTLLVDEVYGQAAGAGQHEALPLEKARQEIDHCFAEPLRISDLARLAHFSSGYFIRAFKAQYGLSPIAYQQEVRIKAARNLLRNTNLLCKEIAARTGFDDIYYFSKTFKKITGMTPTQFRNSR